jgi:hypothetical protein
LAVAKPSDEERRALNLLARHPDGCAETVLLAHGFSYDQLADLVFARLATMQPTVTPVGGRIATTAKNPAGDMTKPAVSAS